MNDVPTIKTGLAVLGITLALAACGAQEAAEPTAEPTMSVQESLSLLDFTGDGVVSEMCEVAAEVGFDFIEAAYAAGVSDIREATADLADSLSEITGRPVSPEGLTFEIRSWCEG